MKDLELFEGKVMCPRCNPGEGGLIYKGKIRNIDQTFFICDKCDALWEKNEFINNKLTCNKNFQDLATFI